MRRTTICSIPVIALVLLIAAPALAMEEPKDQLDKEINTLQLYIHNAIVKVKHGITPMRTAPRGPVAVQRSARMAPAGTCCESNLIAVADATFRLREMLSGLRYQFRDDAKLTGVASIRAMASHLDEMEGRVRQFAGTGETEIAIKFLELALNAVNNLREEKQTLDGCCGDRLPRLAPPAGANEG